MPNYLLADFNTAGGTVATNIEQGTSVSVESPLGVWLRSESAHPYEGLWVLLSRSLEPLDSDLSPSALRSRNPSPPEGSAIAFVPPTTVRLGA